MKVLDLLWYKDANKMKRVVQKLSLPLYALQILIKNRWVGCKCDKKVDDISCAKTDFAVKQ